MDNTFNNTNYARHVQLIRAIGPMYTTDLLLRNLHFFEATDVRTPYKLKTANAPTNATPT